MAGVGGVGGAGRTNLEPDRPADAAAGAAATAAPGAPAVVRSAGTPGRMAAASTIGGGAQVAPLTLPSWYPANFDMNKAVAGARSIIEAQGEKPETIGPGKADTLVF